MVFAKDHSMGIISFVITLLQETILTKNTETALKALLARGALLRTQFARRIRLPDCAAKLKICQPAEHRPSRKLLLNLQLEWRSRFLSQVFFLSKFHFSGFPCDSLYFRHAGHQRDNTCANNDKPNDCPDDEISNEKSDNQRPDTCPNKTDSTTDRSH